MGKWQTSWWRIYDAGRKEEGWSETRGQVCSLRLFICMKTSVHYLVKWTTKKNYGMRPGGTSCSQHLHHGHPDSASSNTRLTGL